MMAHRTNEPPPMRLHHDDIRRTLQALTSPEQVLELRVLRAQTVASPRYAYQASGYFNNAEALIQALSELTRAQGVYMTLHPCKPELLARAHNRLRTADEMRQAAATSDQQVTRLRWLLLDLDPERAAGISSTDEEHDVALAHAQTIKQALTQQGWPLPIEADSGNGAHLLYPIDLPVNEGGRDTGLVHRVLKGLAACFDLSQPRSSRSPLSPPGYPDEEQREPLRVLVDQGVFNPSRICKLYGTLACKGDHTPERPHRMARLLSVPTQQEIVSRVLLEAVAVPVLPAPAIRTQGQAIHTQGTFDLAAWIATYQLDVSDPKPWQGGQRWIFKVCPWNGEHRDHSAYLIQQANGAIAAGCHHQSCQGNGWRELRALYEPGKGREKRSADPLVSPAFPAFQRTSAASAPLALFPTVQEVLPPAWQHLPDMSLGFVLECLQCEEEGDARLYARLFRGRCVYDHTEQRWYEWQGHSWKRDDCKHALLLASGPLAAVYLQASAELSEHAAEEERQLGPLETTFGERGDQGDQETQQTRERYDSLKKTTAALIERARRLKKLHRAQSILIYAQAFLPITSSAWDTDPWLLGTTDGVIDLRSGTLHPGQPEQYIRTIIPTRWQGRDAPAPRFERFLQEIFADRPLTERDELIAFLQRALGYGISGHVTEHVFLMLYGEEGRNGKDTLMTLLFFVLGAVVGPVSNDVILTSGRLASPGSAKPHLCSLQGKRIAWASEADRGARFDVGQVKFLTGGGAISARQLYGRDYIFDPSHLLVLLTNHKPHADAGDAAFWDRLCPIVFNVRFVESPKRPNESQRDPTLGQTLQEEASGILAWLVRGCLQWQVQGLALPSSILAARKTYREEEDTLGDFLQEACVLGERYLVSAGFFYEHYQTWARENGLKAMNGRTFGHEMRKRFPWAHRKNGGVYLGVTKRPEEEEREKGEVVTDHTAVLESAQPSPQADVHGSQTVVDDRSDSTFSKFPHRKDQKRGIETFWGDLSLLSPQTPYSPHSDRVNQSEKLEESHQQRHNGSPNDLSPEVPSKVSLEEELEEFYL